ncbi:MAG: transposase [Paracoccaceae bacterium]
MMLGAELTEHLGFEPGEDPANQSNRRNGTSRKTLKGNDGALPIDVPRDRPFYAFLECVAGQWTAVSSPSWSRRARRGLLGWMTR